MARNVPKSSPQTCAVEAGSYLAATWWPGLAKDVCHVSAQAVGDVQALWRCTVSFTLATESRHPALVPRALYLAHQRTRSRISIDPLPRRRSTRSAHARADPDELRRPTLAHPLLAIGLADTFTVYIRDIALGSPRVRIPYTHALFPTSPLDDAAPRLARGPATGMNTVLPAGPHITCITLLPDLQIPESHTQTICSSSQAVTLFPVSFSAHSIGLQARIRYKSWG
ncbi:hypothetical protein B0H17DRAFT_1209898 [Mycena rosella]|uniref:Uncharacterized protein n=1 Tax=Mycena rosella TaxID=1033263 RepID=A0AAD7CXM9_MYCRO|nr:hypothetical protein B0H17DRAFT_1209898 [Mycena rosella]